MKTKTRLMVVEGAGDIVGRGYGPALAKLKIDNPKDLRVIYTDSRDLWQEQEQKSPGSLKKRERTLRRLKKWGAEFIDKSPSNPSEYDTYLALRQAQVDTVIVATNDASHVDVAEHWLQSDCDRIFIEKPLTSISTLNRARDLIGRGDPRVSCFDHYRARVHRHLRHDELLDFIYEHLGQVTRFRFFLLEDHSGTDSKFMDVLKRDALKNRNGPIENERRQPSLQDGMIFDLMPHMMALLSYFGPIGEVHVRSVKAAQYRGVDFKDEVRAEIENETLAAVEFTFLTLHNQPAIGEAYVGKGVRGAKEFPDMDGNVRVLELEGERGGYKRKIRLDFRNNGIWYVSNKKKSQLLELERDPYWYFMEDIFYSEARGTRLGLQLDHGKQILEKLIDMRHGIKSPLPDTYPLGNRKGGLPGYLEDILETLTPVFGVDKVRGK
jgi:predicted dehydrogenase